MGLLSLMS
jgi:c-di-GMP-related signal transduction protein